MKIDVGSRLIILEPTPEVVEYCKTRLILDNPDYYKKQQMGKWTGDTPKTVALYETVADAVWLPFGCLRDIWNMHPVQEDYTTDFAPVEPVSYTSRINLYPYQAQAVEKAIKAKNGVLVMPCGSGKGLPVDAKICTPTGWKRNGDLQIGDAVVGSDGKATRVTNIFDRGKVDAYKITFSDGVETVCDKDHLWTVQKQSQRAESGNWNVMNAQDIYEHYQNMKCRSQYLYIPIVEPVEFYAYDKTSMNPWLLGFLLGDGCFQKEMIMMSTSEDDLRKKVVDIIGKDYEACEWLSHKSKYDWRFCGGYVLHDIQSLGLNEKHSYEKFIPTEYLYGSIETRLAVLQGLFDADGYISNGHIFEYCTTSKQLADDVVFIVESLGGTAKVKEKIPKYTYAGEKRTGRKAYRIFFKLYRFKPFTSEKHSAVYKERTHYNKAYRIIKKIEPCEPITSRCITVDAEDQLYVTEHFVVTHNTQCGLEIIARLGGRALWLTHTEDLLNQSMERAKAVLDFEGSIGKITAGKVEIGTHITFATVQTLAKKIDTAIFRNVWSVVIVDECMPGDTMIDTPSGKKELKNLHIDDIITSYNRNTKTIENKRVTHVFKSKAHDIVKVKLSNGEEIVCTGNHPIFTQNGQWIDAERLVHDDYVLRLVRQSGRDRYDAGNIETQSVKTRLLLLFKGVFSKRRSQKGCVDGGTPKKGIRNNDENKCKISRSVCGESTSTQMDTGRTGANIEKAERDWTSSEDKMRKRNGIDGATTELDACTCGAECRGLCRVSDTDKNAEGFRVSDMLQGGYSVNRADAGNRGRRKLTLCNRKTKTGQEKRAVFKWVRVESVEVQQQTSDGTFGGLCADGYVYNIEVEDNNNYFADDILVHNCHHAAGSPTRLTQFYKVISKLAARYKFGLTATPKRADGLEQSMFYLIGAKIHEVSREEVEHTTCPIEVIKVETGWMPDYDCVLMGDGTIDYNKVIDAMIHDEDRYQMVFSQLLKLVHPTIVLANRVEYLQRMCDDYNKGCDRKLAVCLSGKGQSKKAKAERKAALQALNNGEIDVIFCTYQLAAEGLDVPNLQYVLFATPEQNERVVTQAAGRVGRKAEKKECGTVIDFVDDFGLYKSWYKSRLKVYKKLECGIIE